MMFFLKIVAIVLLMYGVAMGLGEFLGGEVWLGFILTGGACLVGGWMTSLCAAVKRKNDCAHMQTLLNALDIGPLTKKYPLYAVGIAGAIGFMMAGGKASSSIPLCVMALHMIEEMAKAPSTNTVETRPTKASIK